MRTIRQDWREEIPSEKRNLKTDKDEDQIFFGKLLKMIHFSSYDVYKNNVYMDLLKKVEVNKQYRQSVMNSGNVDFLLL